MTALPTALPAARLTADATPAEVAAFADAELAELIATQVNASVEDQDEACEPIPAAVFRRAAELGVLNYLIPREAGGLGGSRRVFGLLLERIGYLSADLAFAGMLSLFADVPNSIARAGRPALVERYVRPMAAGERFGAFAYTDSGDAFDFRTRVTRHGDRYVLNGAKGLLTGGMLADAFLTYARDENDDMCVLLVDRADPGVRVEPVPTMGLRSAGLARLTLDNVVLDGERMLTTSDGLASAQMFLNGRRLFLVCPLVGAMARTIEICVRHLDTVIREGRPLTQAQTVQARLGNMYAKHLTSRELLHASLDRSARGELNEMFDPVISATKFVITENAVDVGEQAIRLTGWRGYGKGLPIERMYRGALSALTSQTAQDVLEINLGVLAVSQVTLDDQVRRSA